MRIGKNLKLYSGVSRRYCLDVLKNMSEQRLRGNLLSLGLRWIAELAKLQLCTSRLYVRRNAASSNKRLETPPPLLPTKINDDIIEMLFDRYNAKRLVLPLSLYRRLRSKRNLLVIISWIVQPSPKTLYFSCGAKSKQFPCLLFTHSGNRSRNHAHARYFVTDIHTVIKWPTNCWNCTSRDKSQQRLCEIKAFTPKKVD